MIDELKPYPEFRDSGTAWLGDVPAHWEVLPNRAIFTEVNERNHPEEPLLSVTIGRGVIKQEQLLENSSKKDSSNQDKSSYKLVVPADIAYNKMRAWQGAVGVSEHRGIVSPAYIVVRPRAPQNSRYFHYLLRTPAFAKEAERWSYGITSDQWSLRPEHFKAIHTVVPPMAEQDAIVRFLDHADRRIRRYIRAKQKLVKFLGEQKQAIIRRAVTRGLNPDVRFKASELEWLGEIPEHWNVGRIKTEFLNLNTRRIPLSATERGRMTLRRYAYYGASGIIDQVDDFLFDEELLLIAEDGANLVLRNLPLAIIARGQFWVNNHAHILKAKCGSLEYFAALLECIDYSPWITGAAQPKLTQDRLMAIRIPVPPEEEQHHIVTWIRSNTAELEAMIHRAVTEISLLSELRTRLISDAVIGKLDVRETAARLPDLLDEEAARDLLDDDATSLDGDDADAEALDPELQEA